MLYSDSKVFHILQNCRNVFLTLYQFRNMISKPKHVYSLSLYLWILTPSYIWTFLNVSISTSEKEHRCITS